MARGDEIMIHVSPRRLIRSQGSVPHGTPAHVAARTAGSARSVMSVRSNSSLMGRTCRPPRVLRLPPAGIAMTRLTVHTLGMLRMQRLMRQGRVRMTSQATGVFLCVQWIRRQFVAKRDSICFETSLPRTSKAAHGDHNNSTQSRCIASDRKSFSPLAQPDRGRAHSPVRHDKPLLSSRRSRRPELGYGTLVPDWRSRESVRFQTPACAKVDLATSPTDATIIVAAAIPMMARTRFTDVPVGMIWLS